MVKVLPKEFPTETIAKDYIDDLKKGRSISASILAEELNKYVEYLNDKNGLNNRLFVIVDEIGQYISANPDVIGYLQGIETAFARIGNGNLWLAVSSQNKLEQITDQYLQSQDEINKVIDRFEVRIHLTPENLDTVINERVLKKKTEAIGSIKEIYESNKGKLLSTLAFEDSKKYLPKLNKEDFIKTYPFMPYHIRLIQPIYYSIISRSQVNRKLGGTNRSMIKATQGILIDEGLEMKDKKIGELVTLDMFFDQAKEFIDDQMQINIKEAEYLDPYKGQLLVKTLKVLYLLDNDDKLNKDAETIAKLLVSNVEDDYIEILKDVEDGLNILFENGYVERDGYGNYKFISPEEQSFRKEAISRTKEIGQRDINRQIKEMIDGLFNITRINYKNIRPFDIQIIIDDEVRNNKGLIALNLNSVIETTDEVRKQQHNMKSIGDNRNIYWYAAYDNTIETDIQQYLIFKKLIEEYRKKWSSDEDKSYFLRKEEQKNLKLLEDIQAKLIKSFMEGSYIYQGKEYPVPEKDSIKDIFGTIVNIAIPKVYHRFDMVDVKIEKEDISNMFIFNQLSIDLNKLNLVQDTNVNEESAVLKEVLNEIKTLKNRCGQCTGKELLNSFDDEPYGWASEATRLFTVLLFKNGNIELNYEGKDFLDYTEPGIIDIFENEPNFRKTVLKPAVVVDAATRQKCQDILLDYFGEPSEDTVSELHIKVRNTLVDYRNKLSAMKEIISNNNLPFEKTIVELDNIFKEILNSKTQGETLNNFVERLTEYEELLDKYKKLSTFTDRQNGNLKEYKDMRNFLKNQFLIDLDRNTKEGFKKEKLCFQIIDNLKSESFIDFWTDIREDYHKLYDPYVKEYLETHETIYKLYNEKIEEMKINKSYIILKSEVEKADVLRTLSDKICTEEVNEKQVPCKTCRSYIRDMKNLIEAVDLYNEKAIEKLYAYLNKQLEEEEDIPTGDIVPQPVVKYINTNSFPKGDILQSPKSVKQYVNKIEKQLMEEISAGNHIIIE